MSKYFLPSIILFCCCTIACHQPTEKVDFLTSNIDSTVRPNDDFFLFANGKWIKNNPIPDEESRWGIGNLVEKELYDRLRKINENAVAENPAQGTIARKIADFWQSGLDTAAIDKNGISPLKPTIETIDRMKTSEEIVSLAAQFHQQGVGFLFSGGIGQDDKNSEAMAFGLYQGGLGLPERSYYFENDAKTLAVKEAYKQYLSKTFVQLGKDTLAASVSSKNVLELETALAKGSRKLADLRDPYKNYNKMSVSGLNKMTPNFNWETYFKLLGVTKIDSAIVGQPEFYSTVNTLLKTVPIQTWKDYAKLHLILSYASYLDKTTFQNYFDYRKTISGANKPRIRWKRVIDDEQDVMGEALGQLFVKEYFNDKAKERYNNLVEAIRDAYKERIQQLVWMSDSTKKKALVKLASITKKVGYPDKWKDFSTMQIGKQPYVINLLHSYEWWNKYQISKLNKPVDRTEWTMSPQTYNAYYNPSNNEIVLPAGIFAVPGMKDEDLDDAFVYGYAAASTIGHEITHGFDDQGRQYDSKGNLTNWWLPQDSAQFVQRAEKIIQQFNNFIPVDTLHINGKATQGENIADLGGILLGLDAFKKTEAFKKGEKIGGYTPLQRYFLGYAYSWANIDRKERLANQLKTNVHAPAKERVNGPFANIPEFYEAFHIKEGDKMYQPAKDRVNIW